MLGQKLMMATLAIAWTGIASVMFAGFLTLVIGETLVSGVISRCGTMALSPGAKSHE
jgi:hypothetical protein